MPDDALEIDLFELRPVFRGHLRPENMKKFEYLSSVVPNVPSSTQQLEGEC